MLLELYNIGQKRRKVLEGIGTGTAVGATLCGIGSVSANAQDSDEAESQRLPHDDLPAEGMPIPLDSEIISEDADYIVTRVEFEEEYVFVTEEKTGRTLTVEKGGGGLSASVVSKEDIDAAPTTQSEVHIESAHEEYVEEYESYVNWGPKCNYVNGSGSHKMEGISMVLTRDASTSGTTTLVAIIEAILLSSGVGGVFGLGAAAIASLIIGLSGPTYYYGENDVDGGCIGSRCGFRMHEKRYGHDDSSAPLKPDWDEFLDQTSVYTTTLTHI